MSRIHAVIIEDERPTARLLGSMVASLRPEWNVTALAGNVAGAIRWFTVNPQPDIIFLDIHLSDGNAFDLIEQAAPRGLIVFTTAYDEYAVQAFSVNGIDYLLKPIRPERLAEAIAKFERLSQQPDSPQNQAILQTLQTLMASQQTFRTRFLIAKGSAQLVIQVSDIAVFYTEQKTTYAITFQNQKYRLGQPLDSLMEELDPKQFFRTNRQSIMNIHAITKIESYFHNSVVVHTAHSVGDKITVSKEKLTAFKLWLNT